MSNTPPIDLSVIPEDQRDAVLAVLRERDALREANKRLEYLVAELNQAVHGKRSEKLSEDERQLAFEDLETAVAEVETQQNTQTSTGPAPCKPARRNRGNLPKDLPRIERVIEPDSLDCPCGCGEMHRIGEDRTERLEIIPAQLRVIHCPAVHVHMHERGHCPAQICLPRRRRGRHPGTSPPRI